MSFFEPPPPSPPSEPYRPPSWSGPADDVLPGVAELGLDLIRTDDVAVWLGGAWAYPNGLVARLTLLYREEPRDRGLAATFLYRAGWGTSIGGAPPPEQALRLGVRFADGRRATDLDSAPEQHGEEPDAPLLLPRGGGGGGLRAEAEFWLWPLPPPGPLTFLTKWPLYGVPETRVEVDAGSILDAAGRAVTLWS